MNFLGLAVKNIKKSFNNYVMYTVSAVFSVMIFYIFCSIAFNSQFIQLIENKSSVRMIFQVSTIIVAFFSFIFIWYSNSFFIKRRKKEIAIYSMVGMGKKQIGAMLFCENMMIGVLSILLGVLLGTMFSKYFFLMLVALMKQTVEVKFQLIPKAYGITFLVFFVLFLLNSVHSYSIIYRFKLVDLLAASKEEEKPPKSSKAAALLSIMLIITAYSLAYEKTFAELVKLSVPILILVSAGTYLFFNNMIIMIIKAMKKSKRFYYDGINLISTNHIFCRTKSNAKILSVIAILSAVTMTAMGCAYSFYRSTEESLKESSFFSYTFINVDTSLNRKIENTIKKYKNNELISETKIKVADAKINLPVLNKDDFQAKIISQSDYNTALASNNMKSNINLCDNECSIIESNNGDGVKRNYVNSKVYIIEGNKKVDFTIVKDNMIHVISPSIAQNVLIISDKTFDKLYNNSKQNAFSIRGYVINNAENSKELTDELKQIVPKSLQAVSFYEVYNGFYKSSGIMIFIGMFLGGLFLISTLSIISFKQLIEANEDKARYETLRNIGFSKENIKASIGKQLMITFGMPLLVALCHSTAALMIFQRLMKERLMNYCIVIMAVYIFMYYVYYVISMNSYTNIVCDSKSNSNHI